MTQSTDARPRRGSIRGDPYILWVCPMENVQETIEVFILTNIQEQIPNLVSDV